MAPGKGEAGAESTSESEAANERRNSAMEEIVKEFICPISLELPVEPVTAEDGRVYNRADIQKHIDNAEDDNLRSPVTGAPMGPTLVPAVQVQNTLRALIESGAVEDDSAERLKKVIAMRKKAEAGDPEAMCDLGDWYLCGMNGLHKDMKLSYVWCSKAADHNSVRGMADKGFQLHFGAGVDKDEVTGAALLGIAAGRDHAFSCYILGTHSYKGTLGLPKDHKFAKYWLSKALELIQDGEDNGRGMAIDDIEACERMLKELEGGTEMPP